MIRVRCKGRTLGRWKGAEEREGTAAMSSVARERFEAALESLLEEVREDDHILAAILCGSLSHDEVWDKSDIDLVLVCTDDKKTQPHGVALVADDVNIHTTVQPRGDFRRRLESSVRNTFGHSLFAKGRLLFSRDPSIDALFNQLGEIGQRDSQVQAMCSAQTALTSLYKARKWLEIKDDPAYTALWTLFTAHALAEVEVGLQGELVSREALPDALRLNPKLFQTIYADLLDKPVRRESLEAALAAIDGYLEPRAEQLFAPLIEYLDDAGGEPRSSTEIAHYFRRHYDVEHILIACEWLSDIGIIDKAAIPVKLTTRSRMEVDELAFFHTKW